MDLCFEVGGDLAGADSFIALVSAVIRSRAQSSAVPLVVGSQVVKNVRSFSCYISRDDHPRGVRCVTGAAPTVNTI